MRSALLLAALLLAGCTGGSGPDEVRAAADRFEADLGADGELRSWAGTFRADMAFHDPDGLQRARIDMEVEVTLGAGGTWQVEYEVFAPPPQRLFSLQVRCTPESVRITSDGYGDLERGFEMDESRVNPVASCDPRLRPAPWPTPFEGDVREALEQLFLLPIFPDFTVPGGTAGEAILQVPAALTNGAERFEFTLAGPGTVRDGRLVATDLSGESSGAMESEGAQVPVDMELSATFAYQYGSRPEAHT